MTFEELLKQEEPLIKSIAKNYNIPGYSFEDLVQEGRIKCWELYKNKKYNSKISKYSTFLTFCLRRRYKQLYDQSKCFESLDQNDDKNFDEDVKTHAYWKNVRKEVFDKIVVSDSDIIDKIEYDELIEFISKRLSDIEAYIFKLRLEGYKLKDIQYCLKTQFGIRRSKASISMLKKRKFRDILYNIIIKGGDNMNKVLAKDAKMGVIYLTKKGAKVTLKSNIGGELIFKRLDNKYIDECKIPPDYELTETNEKEVNMTENKTNEVKRKPLSKTIVSIFSEGLYTIDEVAEKIINTKMYDYDKNYIKKRIHYILNVDKYKPKNAQIIKDGEKYSIKVEK